MSAKPRSEASRITPALPGWMPHKPLQGNQTLSRNTLKVIGAHEACALKDYSFAKQSHRRTVAATTVLFKMHTPNCPPELKALLPSAHVPGRNTQRVPPCYALSLPRCLDRSFLHSAVTTWNSLRSIFIKDINSRNVHAFKKRLDKPPLAWVCNPEAQGHSDSHVSVP